MAKTVYLGMIGDIMHPGLINIINEGTKYGDVMIGLFTDKAIATHKRLPYLNYEQRKNVVENIKGVSKVIPQTSRDYIPNLRELQADFMVHGKDWREGPLAAVRQSAIDAMKEWGGQVIEPDYTQGVSSTSIQKKIADQAIKKAGLKQ